MPHLCGCYPGICLTSEEKARKTLSQGSRRVPTGTIKIYKHTIRIHKHNNKNTQITVLNRNTTNHEWKNSLKHVQRLTEINKLWNVASCWLYAKNILAMHGPMNVKTGILLGLSDPWRRDGQVFSKRPQESTIIRCVKSQNSADLKVITYKSKQRYADTSAFTLILSLFQNTNLKYKPI